MKIMLGAAPRHAAYFPYAPRAWATSAGGALTPTALGLQVARAADPTISARGVVERAVVARQAGC
ncbi:hypothetical protein [Micromonospora sp. NPDC005173]|uniref:hypothetical protein n=1 Tax=Micromonospora sp. NPDC005173 TaxID=3157165 RepID=UPI0033B26AA3